MTTSTALVAVDDKVEDALKHYGVKGMKWGKRKADKDKEYKPTPTTGGGGADDDHEADLREFQELNEYMGTIFRPDAGPIDYDKFNAAVKRLNELEARMAARNERLEEEQKEKGLPRVRDNRPASDRVPTPTQNPGKMFKEDITTQELIERSKRRRKAAKHDEMDLDDYLMHYGVKGMKWGVRKDRNKSVGTRTKKKSSSSESPTNRGSGESPKSGSSSGSTKSSKNLTTDQKLDRLDKLSEEKNEILNYTDEVKKAAKEVTDSSGETWDGPLKTILEFHPKGVDIADNTADKMGFYGSISDSDVNKLLKDYRKREKKLYSRAVVDASNDVLANMTISEMIWDLLHDEIDSDIDDYLIHYGVKGMKWGVRKDGKPQGYQGGGGSKSKSKKKKKSSDGLSDRLSKLSSATKTKIKNVTDPKRRTKKKIERTKRKAEVAEAKAEAEARVAAAEKKAAEARKATELTRTATTAKSGSGSLSDKELKAVVERMNLEKQYAKHMSDAKPKKMSTTLVNIAKETAIDFAKQKVRSEINKSLGKSYDKFFDAFAGSGSKPSSTSEPKPKKEPKRSEPRAERKAAPKSPPPRTETRTQTTTRPTPRPQDFIARPALPSPPRPSQRALPGPRPTRPSSGGTSARLKSDPTVQKFGKVSMEQIRAHNEGRRYRPFDPKRRR